MENKEHVYISSRSDWRDWLRKKYRQTESIWLVYDKGKRRTLSYEDIVEEALCFGWVDSRPGKVDDTKSKLYISPRKLKSTWSKANKQRIEKLSRQGLMHSSGLKAVALAKGNGSWETLNSSDAQIEPPELSSLLDSTPGARSNFNSFSPSSRKNILEWIYAAKRPETRQKRIAETVEKAAQNIKANHYRQ